MMSSLRRECAPRKQEDSPQHDARPSDGSKHKARSSSRLPPYLRNQPALVLGERTATHAAQGIQTKLTLNQAGDRHEQEADRVADRVMSTSEPRLQRDCPCGGGCTECRTGQGDRAYLQAERFQAGGASEAAAPPIVHEALSSPGEPLDVGTRAFMETRFGQDFSRVRVHADAASAASALAIGARAYTVGSDVVFGAGQYSPQSGAGRRLLAHELAHTIQQRGQVRIQRAPLKVELEKELGDWAKKKGKTVDPKNPNFGFDLQEYAWSLINDPNTHDPIPKPKDKKGIAAWEKKFKKAQLLAEMILAGDPKVTQRETRAAMILNLMAQAGFVTGPVEIAQRMTDASQIESVYEAALGRVEKADAKSLTTITEFFISKKGTTDNPVIDKLTDRSGSFEKRLSKDQLTAILAPLIKKHEKDLIIIEILSEVLVHRADYRQTFSDWMWKEGKGEFLFQLFESDYFKEPGYGPTTFPEVGELKLEADMPWVYANKQRYYVGYLVQLGKEAAVDIKAPKNLKVVTLRTWLDDNTEKFGEALAKKHPTDPDKWIKVYQQIADIFFYHVEGRGVDPDLTGKLGKLKPAAPKKMRLEADCDVLATYAMRLFKGIKDPANPAVKPFEPVGYMALDLPGPGGHAVALMRRDGKYYVISNKEVSTTAVVETKKDEKKADAIEAMKKVALEIYDPDPPTYEVFYADSPTGAMPRALARTEESTRRRDLEP